MQTQQHAAIYLDFENVYESLAPDEHDKNKLTTLTNYLKQRWPLALRRAYGNWRWRHTEDSVERYTPEELRWNAYELVQVFAANPRNREGRNHADLALALHAFETAIHHEHINTFIIVSNDSDFTPLAAKLHELGCHTVGVGTHNSSRYLPAAYGEFVYLEELFEKPQITPPPPAISIAPAVDLATLDHAHDLLGRALATFEPASFPLHLSTVKGALKNIDATFDHRSLGFEKFSAWLKTQSDLVRVETDEGGSQMCVYQVP